MNNRIRELRKQKGITMKQLGSVLGLAESTISQYETGKREPDLKTLTMLADYFSVTTDYLLGKEPQVIGSQIIQARWFRNMSQRELAEKLNISTTLLSKYESNHAKPDLQRLRQIAAVLDVSVDSLLGYDEPLSSAHAVELFPGPGAPVDRDRVIIVPGNHDIAFYNGYQELTEDQKETLRDMVRVMRERNSRKKEAQD